MIFLLVFDVGCTWCLMFILTKNLADHAFMDSVYGFILIIISNLFWIF